MRRPALGGSVSVSISRLMLMLTERVMAASVLLGSAENTGLHFTVAGGTSGTRPGNVLAGSNNGLGSVCPAPWNRSLDRALDEATATGCLNLSGRKLKEFPRSAANHDLTDTTRAGEFPGTDPGPARPAGVRLFWPNRVRAVCRWFRDKTRTYIWDEWDRSGVRMATGAPPKMVPCPESAIWPRRSSSQDRGPSS